MGDLADLLRLVDATRPTRNFVTVGIGGHGASGKSTLAGRLAAARDNVQIVPTDAFWNGSQFELARLRSDVLDVLLDGLEARYDAWDWASGAPAGKRVVTPEGIVVIDGVCALHQMFRRDLDVRVWVDAPVDVRLARGVARDGEASRHQWAHVWMPNEARYVAADRPVESAHLVIDGTA